MMAAATAFVIIEGIRLAAPLVVGFQGVLFGILMMVPSYFLYPRDMEGTFIVTPLLALLGFVVAWVSRVVKDRRTLPAPATGTAAAPEQYGFNWGALLVPPLWAFFHRLWLLGTAYVVINLILAAAEVRALASIVHLGLGIYLGVKGNSILWKSGRYPSFEVLRKKERDWAIFGVFSTVCMICLLIGILIAAR